MKKTICLCIACVLVFSFHGAAQCGSKNKSSYTKKSCGSEKSSALKKYTVSQKTSSTLKSKWVPVIGSSFQLGLCTEENPIAFNAGIEKFVSKHIAISGDVQFWRTNWAMLCDDVLSQGKYTSVIPSVKFRFDPGKQYKGFFIGAGIGYVFAKDKGTEQTFVTDATSGIKNPQGEPTPADWGYSGVAPSFSLGFSFKVHKVPVTVINTNYFAKTSYGFTDIATGVGLNIGLAKVKSQKNKSCRVVQKSCSSSKIVIEKKVKTVSENKAKTGCSKGN